MNKFGIEYDRMYLGINLIEILVQHKEELIKEFLADLEEIMGWSKNELSFDSETNIRLKRSKKKWKKRVKE